MISTKEYFQLKRAGYSERKRKDLSIKVNGRSADFIIPSAFRSCDYSCVYCVEEGTLISTSKGLVPVEQIQETSEVVSYDNSLEQLELAHVCHIQQREVDLIFEIQIGEVKLCVSSEHPVMTQRGWIEAQNLVTEDFIMYLEDI